MRFFRSALSFLIPAVFIFMMLPAAAEARTAVIIGDSQAQGLNRPLTASLEAYDVNVAGTAIQEGLTTNRVFTELGVRGLVSSRNPDIIIVIVGGNDTVGTSAAQQSAYEGVLSNAIVQMGGTANAPKIVWVGPAFSRDEGVQARHDRTSAAQQSFLSGRSVRWIDGRTGSREGPYQQDSNPGDTEGEIRNRNTHLTNDGYRRWACELAPQLTGQPSSGSCPTGGSEADIAFSDVPGDVSSAAGSFSTTCDPADSAPTPITLGVNIGGVQEVAGLPEYINTAYRYLVSVILVIAIIMVVYGGFLYLTGAAGVGSIQRGKQIIKDALIGMVIVLAAYSILQTINPNTTQFKLNPTKIECIAIPPEERDPNATEGGTIRNCVVDADCGEGRFCLRTAASGNPVSLGQCSEGRVGELCRCSGTGCDLREVDGSPTNNNGTTRVDCQEGTCRQAGSSLAGDATGNWVCNSGTAGSQCNMNTDPPVTCAAGNICEQNSPDFPGRCVAGNYRDQTLDPRPVCSTLGFGPGGSERYYRETEQGGGAFVGGCNLVSSDGVNTYCMEHRYRCSSTAANRNTCGEEEFATLFGNTGNAYNTGAAESWDFNRPPEILRPWSYARFGCRKAIGDACTSDEECPSMCVGGTCSGFCAVRVRTGSLSLSAGAFPSRDQLEGACSSGCGSDTWSAADFGVNFSGDYLGTDIDGMDIVAPMRIEKAACYPKRATGSKCDYTDQCISNHCRFEAGATYPSTPFPSFSAPLDMTAGFGTCTAT
jgi:lysophospholipase L1-like esterase